MLGWHGCQHATICTFFATLACLVSPHTPPQVIGRVSGLTLLNGADVKPRERRDCELRYLQNVLAEQAEAGASGNGQQQQLMRQHPRLAELQGKYGQVRWGTASCCAQVA